MEKISLVLATYNGEKYILDQLKSIYKQTKQLDEVVIMDDCSTDKTVAIIYSFIDLHNLKTWCVYKNDNNIGWKKNFMNGIHKSTGDIIFFSDQDDIWEENKVEKMYSALLNNKDIAVLACNLLPFSDVMDDSSVRVMSKRTIKQYGNNKIQKVKFDRMWAEPLRPGCTMCFRKFNFCILEKIWFEDCPHDLLIWCLGMVQERVYVYNEVLMKQRIHFGSSTPLNRKNKANRLEVVNRLLKITDNILKCYDISDYKTRKYLHEYLSFLNYRREFISNISPISFFKCLMNINYYPKISSFFADMYCALIK